MGSEHGRAVWNDANPTVRTDVYGTTGPEPAETRPVMNAVPAILAVTKTCADDQAAWVRMALASESRSSNMLPTRA
jgi:hypothetical protein